MECKGRLWQLCCNYIHDKQANMKIYKMEKKKKNIKEKEKYKREKMNRKDM